jgi:hypothetical protein
MLIDDLEFNEMSHLDLKGAFCWQEFEWNGRNDGGGGGSKTSTAPTKESPAVVKEIPKQSSKDVKANSRYAPGKYGLNVATARVPASQLKPGRSKMAMLRKGERTEEGRPTPREIKLASAGIKGARAKANRDDRRERVAKGQPARHPNPVVERLRIKRTPILSRRQKDIVYRSNPGNIAIAKHAAMRKAESGGRSAETFGNDASRNVNLRGDGWENRRK